ncbi:hypothetical protein KY330_05170 [Candidatus Woesearchaeota archaeon]|nr:hypothetical protein [Candidatus Woesearchaeota archaeon]
MKQLVDMKEYVKSNQSLNAIVLGNCAVGAVYKRNAFLANLSPLEAHELEPMIRDIYKSEPKIDKKYLHIFIAGGALETELFKDHPEKFQVYKEWILEGREDVLKKFKEHKLASRVRKVRWAPVDQRIQLTIDMEMRRVAICYFHWTNLFFDKFFRYKV